MEEDCNLVVYRCDIKTNKKNKKTSYIHSESRPQLLEYLAGGFQTVGYKFSDIPCPNSGNYVNF